jgi:type II secretory pathway pseudopilin PulG
MYWRLSENNAILILPMNYEKQNAQDPRRRTHDASGFTLAELVVAIGIMAVVVFIVGTVFKTSIASYRIASAQAEIMHKFRAITDQLNSDFRGLRKDAPLFIWFRQDPNDPDQRFDQIMFFADGDFQSTGLWANKTIVGNVARIYYGHARGQNSGDYPFDRKPINRVLAKRQHILTADNTLPLWPDTSMVTFGDIDTITNPKQYYNDLYEFDQLSLSQWQVVPRDAYDANILNPCFDRPPVVNKKDPNTLHNLLCENVGSFSIQWGYFESGSGWLFWFPSNNPDGNGAYSHFDLNNRAGFPSLPDPNHGYGDFDTFGAFFNMYQGSQINYWGTPDLLEFNSTKQTFPANFYPRALKFTFTLYDSRGVFKDGQTFTHIVYIGD